MANVERVPHGICGIPKVVSVMKRARFSLSLLLAISGICFVPASAQPKIAQPKIAQPKTAAKIKAAPRNATPFSYIVGAGLGALLVGGALGYALRKPNTSTSTTAAADFFDHAPFPLALVGENEKIARHNPAFERFFGPRASGFPELFHPEDLTAARAHIHEIIADGRADFALDCRFFGAEGAPLHAVLSGQKAAGVVAGARRDSVLLAWRDTTAQARAETELSGARAAISALYQVIAGDKSRDLDDKIRSLLALGCGRFELPVGVLGRISGAEFETLWVQSADRRVRPLLTISTALSPEKASQNAAETVLLGLQWLPTRSNCKSVPFVAKNEGTAYFGAPVLIGDELFGMLSFSGLAPRARPFEDGEIELLQLMADWVGGEIERHNGREALEKQQLALLDANEKLERLATHDPLTGVKNRRAFGEKLDEEWSRARRYGTPLSLVMLDVDKFKQFNDSFGHPAGDVVLKRVASVLMAAIRATDFLARYGGEEFVLILPNTDAEGALILANRLRAGIENAPWKERQITASIGVSTLVFAHKSGADLLQSADGALYHAKESGRNRVVHTRDMEAAKISE